MSEFLDVLKTGLENRRPGLLDGKRSYAVLVPLVERDGEWFVLYEVRAATLRRQPGEVCFPGGRMEPGESAVQCALRETGEELGIPPEDIQVLGELDFVAYRDNSILYPVLGVIADKGAQAMQPSPDEVGEVLFVPLSHLLTTKPLEYDYELIPTPAKDFPYEVLNIPRDYKWRRGYENVAVYPWRGHAIWGMTGRITRHAAALIREWVNGSEMTQKNLEKMRKNY